MANKKGYKKLNWQLASAEELGQYLFESGGRKHSPQIAHYKESGNAYMLEKIERAVEIAKLLLLEERARVLREKLYGGQSA